VERGGKGAATGKGRVERWWTGTDRGQWSVGGMVLTGGTAVWSVGGMVLTGDSGALVEWY
jgi:hypothetical protein